MWSPAASPVRLADDQGNVVAGADQRPQSGHGRDRGPEEDEPSQCSP